MQGLHSTSTSGWSSFSIFVIMVALLLTMMRPVQPLALRVRSSSAAARSVAVRRSQSSLFCTSLPTTTTTTTQATTSAPHLHDDILQQYEQELIALRGKPELVDRLENLVSRYPGVEMNPALYRLLYPFAIDDFQADGIQALRDGQNVLVMTPTGSGKTLVGELAIYFALMLKLRVAYTTPLKALSNQKFQDFSRKFGADRVGLLTGDISINRNAQILVMTTEVFRNMIYDTEDMQQLNDVFMVCFDEFHYMNDPERGTVWEESVISCPTHIRILALSATMGNVEDVQDWIGSIHGPTTLVQSNHRPVPLRYYYALKKSLLPFFRDHNAGPGAINGIIRQADGNFDANMKVNPAIINLEEEAMTRTTVERRGRSTSFRSAPVSILIPKYTDVVKALQKSSKLPAIFFIFSRVGCEEAAKTTVTAKLNLLSMEELQLMNKAIALFIRNNPLIPITRQNILMLQAGVGVHHAGLIGVWKSFIEDLFNANVIKVLYATETLAAGVNMPARTTVITSLTKKINSEVIKLKTSQVLQMAGRAGRRGIDVEGNVIVMRNKFDELKLAHSILVSKVDGIKSHFKASYGFAVKLLETRSLSECRALMERGFGAYSMMKRIQRRASLGDIQTQEERAQEFRSVLLKYGVKESRDYVKILRRMVREERQLEDFKQAMHRQDDELVNALAEYVPLGSMLLLKSGETAYFLGDAQHYDQSVDPGAVMTTKQSSYAIITSGDARILLIQSQHIQSFAGTEEGLSAKAAALLTDFVPTVQRWRPLASHGKDEILEAVLDWSTLPQTSMLAQIVQQIIDYPATMTPEEDPTFLAQQGLVHDLQHQVGKHPISQQNDSKLIVEAVKYLGEVNNPMMWLDQQPSMEMQVTNSNNTTTTTTPQYNIYAWKLFENTLRILQKFNALDENYQTTPFGQLVSSLTTENELWLAMILQQEGVERLEAPELAALVCATMIDGKRASNTYVKTEPSENVKDVIMSLEERFWDLHNTQEEYGLEFPIQMGGEVSGIAEAWCKGVTWKDLCSMTSLDQGDLCKILRRTVELLQQIPNAYNVKDNVRDRAEQAIRLMDRFPVANTMDNDNYNPQSTKLSTSSNSGDNEENPKSFEEMVSSEISEEDMLLIENASKEVIVLDEEDEGDDNKEDENEVEEVTDEEPKRNPALTKSFKGFQNAFSPEQTVDELERLLNDLSTNTREKQVKGKAKDKTSRDKKVRTIEGVDKNYSDNKKSASGSKKKEGNTFEAEKSNSNNKKKRQ